MAKKATRKTTRPPPAIRLSAASNKSVKPRAKRMPKVAAVKPRRKPVDASETKPKMAPRPISHGKQAPESADAMAMTGYENPMFDPPIKVFDSVPSFPSDFEQLRMPKSVLAREIANKAVSGDEYVRGMVTQKKGNAQTFRINPYSLDIVPGFNVHTFDDEASASYIWGLSESIASQGVLRALLVHYAGGRILVDAGEHRLRATFVAIELRGAPVEGVPIIFAPRGQSDVDRLYQQRLDNTIRRLTILEEGILVKRIIAKSALNEDDAIREIARNYGTSVAIVQSYLETAALPEEVQHMIRHDRIGATFARQIFRDTGRDPERTVAIINEAKLRVGDNDDKKIMPKHIPVEDLARARAESGTPRRIRSSSRATFQTPRMEPAQKTLARPTKSSSEDPAPNRDSTTFSDAESTGGDAPPEPPTEIGQTREALVISLLQEAEPGIMQNGLGGLGFANQQHFEQLCGLLGKLSVLPPAPQDDIPAADAEGSIAEEINAEDAEEIDAEEIDAEEIDAEEMAATDEDGDGPEPSSGGRAVSTAI